jgi:hypothetical protein
VVKVTSPVYEPVPAEFTEATRNRYVVDATRPVISWEVVFDGVRVTVVHDAELVRRYCTE